MLSQGVGAGRYVLRGASSCEADSIKNKKFIAGPSLSLVTLVFTSTGCFVLLAQGIHASFRAHDMTSGSPALLLLVQDFKTILPAPSSDCSDLQSLTMH